MLPGYLSFHSSLHSLKGTGERVSYNFLDSKSRSVMSFDVVVRPIEKYTRCSPSTSFSVNQITETRCYQHNIGVWLPAIELKLMYNNKVRDCHDNLPGVSTCSKVTSPVEEESSVIFFFSFPVKICRMRY